MGKFSDKRFKETPDKPAPGAMPEEALPADPLAAVAMTPEDMLPAAEPTPEPELPPPPPAPKSAPLRVRVTADGKVMLGACMHRFRAGNVLDANHYDAGVFKQLLGALKTEPLE